MDETALVNLSDLDDEVESSTPRKRKHYSNHFKLKVVMHSKDISKKSASETFHVDRSSVKEWVRNEDKLKLQA